MPSTPEPVGPGRCPLCGGRLGEPVSGDVHCFVTCLGCGTEFELDDPRLASSEAGGRAGSGAGD